MLDFLYEKYDAISGGLLRDFFIKLVPSYITENLNYKLRSYQKEGIGRYIYYTEKDKENYKYPEHLLFNMATGSGKTMMMAAIILEKFKQGERNFLFFVNNTNIIEKTRSNFLFNNSDKYLFTDSIMIDGKRVEIREVSDFSDSQDEAINIVFTTIQQLHIDLNTPRENRLSYEQFEDINIVMLADEAHHLNAGLGSQEKKDNSSWTKTIENIQRNALKSSLFEFTATIDLKNSDINSKYRNHLLYKYDLKNFRLDGYSKDILFHLVDDNVETRMLQAIIISQFRKKVALKNGINLKPLILFKSHRTTDSAKNESSFLEMLNNLTVDQIDKQNLLALNSNGILTTAFNFFKSINLSHDNLIAELKDDFRKERLMLIDSKNKTDNKLIELNTLEEASNEIRAIFAVDMLNEGWDVLNLFDIVRLYDTRDGKTTKNGFVPGATTNTEKQLIGRGARYYPFVFNNDKSMKYKRKFDFNEFSEMRVIEQLHYHSKDNPRYISELKQVLRESGIYDDQTMVEHQIKLKRSFRKTKTYKNGYVWMNERIPLTSIDNFQLSFFGKQFPTDIDIELPTHGIGDFSVFDSKENEGVSIKQKQDSRTFKIGSEISANVLRHAVNQQASDFNFQKVSKTYPGIPSMEMFYKEIQKNVAVTIIGDEDDVKRLSQDNKLFIASSVIQAISDEFINVQEKFVGTDRFEKKRIKDVFDSKILRKYVIDSTSNKESGKSQKDPSETKIYEDIDSLNWYAYTDNFGTSEEKLVIRMIKHHMKELETKLTDIFVLRNEKAVRIYNFENGAAFEPDFIMFANDSENGNTSWQFFIEPKGSQFIDNDGNFDNGKEGWKQELLKEITRRDKAGLLIDDNHYRIIGLPFYNHGKTKNDFIKVVKDTLAIDENISYLTDEPEQFNIFDEFLD